MHEEHSCCIGNCQKQSVWKERCRRSFRFLIHRSLILPALPVRKLIQSDNTLVIVNLLNHIFLCIFVGQPVVAVIGHELAALGAEPGPWCLVSPGQVRIEETAVLRKRQHNRSYDKKP